MRLTEIRRWQSVLILRDLLEAWNKAHSGWESGVLTDEQFKAEEWGRDAALMIALTLRSLGD